MPEDYSEYKVHLKVEAPGNPYALELVDPKGNVLATNVLKSLSDVYPGDTVAAQLGPSIAKQLAALVLKTEETTETLTEFLQKQLPEMKSALKKPVATPVPGPVTNVNVDFDIEITSTRLVLGVEWTYTGTKDLAMSEAIADLVIELANSGNLGLAEWLMTKLNPGSI